MDTTSLLILIVASVYAMLSLMSLVLLARRVSMLDYCLRELEKKMPILIPSDLAPLAAAQLASPVATPAPVVVSAATGLTAPIGSIELKKAETVSKPKKSVKGKSPVTKKGKK